MGGGPTSGVYKPEFFQGQKAIQQKTLIYSNTNMLSGQYGITRNTNECVFEYFLQSSLSISDTYLLLPFPRQTRCIEFGVAA